MTIQYSTYIINHTKKHPPDGEITWLFKVTIQSLTHSLSAPELKVSCPPPETHFFSPSLIIYFYTAGDNITAFSISLLMDSWIDGWRGDVPDEIRQKTRMAAFEAGRESRSLMTSLDQFIAPLWSNWQWQHHDRDITLTRHLSFFPLSFSQKRQATENPHHDPVPIFRREWTNLIRSVGRISYLQHTHATSWFSTTLHAALHQGPHITTQTIAPKLPNQHQTVAFTACRAWKEKSHRSQLQPSSTFDCCVGVDLLDRLSILREVGGVCLLWGGMDPWSVCRCLPNLSI